MRISAKADYGIRALIELAALEEEREGPVKRDHIGQAQEIPVTFLENILLELKRAGIVRSVRGQAGGFRLAREPGAITLAEIIWPTARTPGSPTSDILLLRVIRITPGERRLRHRG